jgi:hypothetical protein
MAEITSKLPARFCKQEKTSRDRNRATEVNFENLKEFIGS